MPGGTRLLNWNPGLWYYDALYTFATQRSFVSSPASLPSLHIVKMLSSTCMLVLGLAAAAFALESSCKHRASKFKSKQWKLTTRRHRTYVQPLRSTILWRTIGQSSDPYCHRPPSNSTNGRFQHGNHNLRDNPANNNVRFALVCSYESFLESLLVTFCFFGGGFECCERFKDGE
jgi:hypothetical protein